MSNSQQMKKGLSVRDLITTGILAALYMVCAMIGEAIFGFFPVLTFLCPLSIALLCGPVYMLILAKVPKHGPIIVTGILVGGVLFVLGMYWSMCLAYCILGVVADLLAGSGNFRNKGRNLLSYMIFVLSPVFSYGMLWFDRDAYVQYLVEKGTEQTYMDTMVSTAQNWMLPAMIIGLHPAHPRFLCSRNNPQYLFLCSKMSQRLSAKPQKALIYPVVFPLLTLVLTFFAGFDTKKITE